MNVRMLLLRHHLVEYWESLRCHRHSRRLASFPINPHLCFRYVLNVMHVLPVNAHELGQHAKPRVDIVDVDCEGVAAPSWLRMCKSFF